MQNEVIKTFLDVYSTCVTAINQKGGTHKHGFKTLSIHVSQSNTVSIIK